MREPKEVKDPKEPKKVKEVKEVKEKLQIGAQGLFNKKVLGNWILAAALLLQTILFYRLMGMEIHFVILALCTFSFLCLFFFGFKNRWIPFGVCVIFSVLMFADVTFNAYFNGYLSVDMLGSAQYVGDVLDIILQVIRPEFFLLFLWMPFGAVGIFLQRRGRSAEPSGSAEPQRSAVPSVYRREIIFAVLLLLLMLNPLRMILFQSVGNLEFFSYHIKDVVKATTGIGRETFEAVADANYRGNEEDPLFGIAEGKNLIVVQIEALQNFLIGAEYNGREITPVLNSLIREDSLYFDHYYMQIGAGNTSDAEFATNNSLYGTSKSYTYEIYKDNGFKGLPWLLMDRGYSTIAMHGYEGSFWSREAMYPAQGFQTFVDADGFKNVGTATPWGINDQEFYKQAVAYLAGEKEPFYGFLISLTSHTPFELPKALLKKGGVELLKEHKKTRFGNYISAAAYADYALGTLLAELKKEGLYDNSVIAVYGDHFGLSISDGRNEELMTEFLGKSYQFDSMANIPLIIHIPGAEAGELLPQKVSKAGGQLDFLPTMAYLMGFEELDTLYLGNNLLVGENGFVIQDRYAPPGSFLTNSMAYLGIGDGVFETGKAWNIDTGEEIKKDSGMKKLWRKAMGLTNLSRDYLEQDALRSLYYPSGEPAKTDMKMPKVAKPKKAESATGGAITSEGGILSGGAIAPEEGRTSDGSITSGDEIASDGGIALEDGLASGGAINEAITPEGGLASDGTGARDDELRLDSEGRGGN